LLKCEAETLAANGLYNDALLLFMCVLGGADRVSRQRAKVLDALAQCHLALDQEAAAVKYGLQAVAADPTWGEPFVTLGRAQLNLGQFSNAEVSLSTALRLSQLELEEQSEVKDDLLRAQRLHKEWQQQQDDKELKVGDKTLRLRQIRGTQDDAGERHGTGTVIWECGIVLAKYLNAEQTRFPNWLCNKRVLELGSGTGVAGLAASALGATVCLTDVPEVLPLLRLNVGLNAAVLGPVEVQELDWERHTLSDTYDIILAADLVFSARSIVPLISLLSTVPGTPYVLWCHKRRHEELDAELFQTLTNSGFACDLVPCTLSDPDYSSDRIRIYRLVRLGSDFNEFHNYSKKFTET
jgi:predicted nicotinamide N-methyase